MSNHTQIIQLIDQVDKIKTELVKLLKATQPEFKQGDMIIGIDGINEFAIFENYDPSFAYPYLCNRIGANGKTIYAHKSYKSIRHMDEEEVELLEKIKKLS